MEVRLQPEKEAQLAEIAARRGLKTGELAEQVLSRYLDSDKGFIAVVNLGLAAADRGEFMLHDEIGRRIKHILQP
jgi:predicted transcriptional regulator